MAGLKSKGRPLLDEVGVGPVRARFSGYPSRGLTPESLTAIFSEADAGDIMRQSQLFEEIEEKDAHIGAVLATRRLAAASLQWEVQPASEARRDMEAASFTREALMRVGNLDEALMDLMDAVGKGFSVSEIIWELDRGSLWAVELRQRSQGIFTFMERGGGLSRMPRLLSDEEPLWGEELPEDKFIVHGFRGRSTALSRSGLLRPCAWLYLFKNYTLKDWIIFCERYAQPVRVGKYSPGASDAERAVLRDAVMNLGSDAAAVISESTVIEFIEAGQKGGTADVYESLAGYCDRAVSKAVLGQTLTTEQTGGTYATAQVHERVRQDIIEADSRALARTLTTQLIEPLVRFNRGSCGLPRLSFTRRDSEDLGALASTCRTLSEMGLRIPDAWLRERFGLPAPEEAGHESNG
jgi:phage gp29-like protein